MKISDFAQHYKIFDIEASVDFFTKNLNKKKAPCFSYGDEFLFFLTF